MRLLLISVLFVTLFGFTRLGGLNAYGKENDTMPDLKGKKVLMIIAGRNFRDEEFSEPYDLLKKCGATVTIASSTKGRATGMLGKVVVPDMLITECKIEDYDGVVFIGGSGASEYWNNRTAHAIARSAVEHNKVLGAICFAPPTLANAGVLKGRKAVCFPSVEGALAQGGAVLVNQDVVRDGNIVTATGPEAAKAFAETLVSMLQ